MREPIVAIDSNVWISALQFGKGYGPPVRVLEQVRDHCVLAIADEMQDEVIRILVRKFGWSVAEVRAAMRPFLLRSIRVVLTGSVKVCRDPKDDMFLECVALAGADFLVGGDADLLVLGRFGKTQIMTPAQFLALSVSVP